MKIDTNSAANRYQASPRETSGSADMNRQDFLLLLTTQLSQQDPLNPMDNQQFVAQLSQMASLERLENMSGAMQQLAMAQSANTSAQVVSFIGRDIIADSNAVNVKDGQPAHVFGVDVPRDAAEVQVTVKDKDGKVVRTMNVGACSKGRTEVSWDGMDDNGAPVKDGEYTFEVVATDDKNETVQASTYTTRKVVGVTYENGFPRLLLESGGDVGLGQVREIK